MIHLIRRYCVLIIEDEWGLILGCKKPQIYVPFLMSNRQHSTSMGRLYVQIINMHIHSYLVFALNVQVEMLKKQNNVVVASHI